MFIAHECVLGSIINFVLYLFNANDIGFISNIYGGERRGDEDVFCTFLH